MKMLMSCIAACLLLGGCATDTTGSTEPLPDREYRTGSNIPQKARPGDGVTTMSAEEMERARSATTATMIPRRGN